MTMDQNFSSMFTDLRSRGACRPHFQQLATYHPEFGQREQDCKLGGVFRQTTISRLGGLSALVRWSPTLTLTHMWRYHRYQYDPPNRVVHLPKPTRACIRLAVKPI